MAEFQEFLEDSTSNWLFLKGAQGESSDLFAWTGRATGAPDKKSALMRESE
jgi:hypothetical protein